MVERFHSGILGLDKVLRGGLPKGSFTLVIGPTGSGKTLLGLQFLLEGLYNNRACVLVDTIDLIPVMKETASTFGWDPNLLENMVRFDSFYWRTGTKSNLSYSSNPGNLTELSIGLTRLIEEKQINSASNSRLVFDSFSDVILHGSEFSRLLPVLRSKLLKAGITSLFLVEGGLHDDKLIAGVEHESDGTIVLNADEKGRFLMVKRMIHTPTELKWIPFNISQGIEIMADMFFR